MADRHPLGSRGTYPREEEVDITPEAEADIPATATAAVGLHPTGMHCCLLNLCHTLDLLLILRITKIPTYGVPLSFKTFKVSVFNKNRKKWCLLIETFGIIICNEKITRDYVSNHPINQEFKLDLQNKQKLTEFCLMSTTMGIFITFNIGTFLPLIVALDIKAFENDKI